MDVSHIRKHLSATLADLTEDLEELLYLAESAHESLVQFGRQAKMQEEPRAVLDATVTSYNRIRSDIKEWQRQRAAWNEDVVSDLLAFKKKTARALRSLQGTTGALMVSTDWQSPSFETSGESEAGMQTGKIIGTINDYKRDAHFDARDFENAFQKEYLGGMASITYNATVTSSGMAAFATVMNALILSDRAEGTVLVGANSYFELKRMLKKAFRGRMVSVPEMDTEEILRAVEVHKPSVIFLDTLCNTENLAAPNLKELLPRLAKTVAQGTFLVLDNSCLGPMIPIREWLPKASTKLHTFVFESLNKFYQFGFDRVTGGVIWTSRLTPLPYVSFRHHLGTIMPDASVHALPLPNGELLKKRMARIGRNAQFLAQELDAYIQTGGSKIFEGVVYAGLPSHEAYAWMHLLPFHGASFVLKARAHFHKPAVYKKFLADAIKEARERNIDLVAGTSFGLNTTRVYLTALYARDDAKPFLRISPGTETRAEIESLLDIFKAVIL